MQSSKSKLKTKAKKAGILSCIKLEIYFISHFLPSSPTLFPTPHLNHHLISSLEVLFSLYFWIKGKFIWSCLDLSPHRPYQELRQILQNNQLYRLKILSLFSNLSLPIWSLAWKIQWAPLNLGDRLLIPQGPAAPPSSLSSTCWLLPLFLPRALLFLRGG